MSPEAALAELAAHANPERAEGSRAYHKADRPYLGTTNPDIDDCVRGWRAVLDIPGRVTLADGLWNTNIHEARIAAAKLLTKARIKQDPDVWKLIASWVPSFDAWAIADHAMIAAQKRLVASPSRIDEVEGWTTSPSLWTRRAALVATLPWTKQNHPKPEDLAIRDRVLGWAATYVDDRAWFIQKAIAWWLRDLSKHDPERTRTFLAQHGSRLKPFARKEATRHIV